MKGDNFALVRRPPSSVEKAGAGARRIQSAIVADTLALAKKQQSRRVAAKFRIGDYKWREPDYRQILTWAKALGVKPEEVIEGLLQGPERTKQTWRETQFENGRLLKVHWDFDLLPLWEFELDEPLETTHLTFWTGSGRRPRIRLHNLRLPNLSHLYFADRGFIVDDCNLSGVPNLTTLACWDSQIQELDLSKVAGLEFLMCQGNRLSDLDLSAVPNLVALVCSDNEISGLDLSGVPHMVELDCSSNKLSGLDLSKVPRLTQLNCNENRLTQLDLSKVPQLVGVGCSFNEIRELHLGRLPKLDYLACISLGLRNLDLSATPGLTILYCDGNEIQALDLSKVPGLTELDCSSNPISVLDIRPLARLRELKCDAESTRLIQRPDQHF